MLNPVSLRFDDARLKVERANRHINEVDAVIKGFAQSDFYKLVTHYDPETGQNTVQFHATAGLPRNLSLAIGDAIHNMRCALDFVTTAIVGTDSDRITFPMHAERDILAKSSQLRDVQKAAPNVAQVILDEIRPYKTGNYIIWALGKCDNIDKHKLIVATYQVARVAGICVENADKSFTMNNETVFFDSVGVAVLVTTKALPGPFKITSHGKPAISVTFGQGTYFEGSSVIPTLVQLSQAVLHVIETIEGVFFRIGRS